MSDLHASMTMEEAYQLAQEMIVSGLVVVNGFCKNDSNDHWYVSIDIIKTLPRSTEMPHIFRSLAAWENFRDKATDYRAWMARKKLEGPKRTNKPRQFANCTCGHHMGGFTGRPRGLECVKCHKRYWIYADGTMKERARYDR